MLKMAGPIIHHRHPEFTKILARVTKNLQYLFQTEGEVLTLTSSGTGAMEAAVCNLHSPGDKALFANGGKFGERWGELLRTYGVDPVEVKEEWGTSVTPEQIADALQKHSGTKAVYLTQ